MQTRSLAPRLLPPLLLLGLVACGPVSREATGEIADAVNESIAGGTESFDHADWGAMLAAGTRGGLVDYAYFKAERAALEAYLGRIAGANLGALAPEQLKALLINAYNAYTVLSILDHPDVDSIRDIDGVWDKRTHAVGGFDLTLDNMEHNLLRPFFKDPRIHVAVNCASQSCAPLPPWSFEGETLDDQLDDWTTQFFNDPKYMRQEEETLYVSKLLDWYGGDFVAEGWEPRAESIATFISDYAEDELADFLDANPQPKIVFLDYDWGLNQAP
ncbi:MAG: DUF547 domain-containing protein [Acidobacteriota bacterium]